MKAIIFDMDGLMVDTERLYFETERQIAHNFGRKIEDTTLWKMMGRKPVEALAIMIDDLNLDTTPGELLEIRNGIMAEKYRHELLPMPGLFEIISKFRGRLKLAIATGSQKEFLDIVVDNLGIRNSFNMLQSSDGITNGKPDPEIYLKTIEGLKVRPEETIVLEDSSNGALAGKNAGCYTIAVVSEYTKHQDFGFVDYKTCGLTDAARHIEQMLEGVKTC